MNKRGQNWSIEMLITASLFITFFIMFIGLSYLAVNGDLRDVELISDEISQRLLSATDPIGIVDARNAVNMTKLIDISDMTPEEFEEFLGYSGDVCLILKDARGEIIPINGKYGAGSSKIKIEGKNCSELIS